MRTCRHCGRKKVNRPKGLCWSCYYRPGVRSQYPSLGTFGSHRGLGNGNLPDVLPAVATAALPGSPAKMACLAARAAGGVRLWHPRDARLALD